MEPATRAQNQRMQQTGEQFNGWEELKEVAETIRKAKNYCRACFGSIPIAQVLALLRLHRTGGSTRIYCAPYVKSSNKVTLSALVQTPTLPASLNVSSSHSRAFLPS